MPLQMMVLDINLEDDSKVLLYGITADNRRICCTINDFQPYFWFPAPVFSSEKELEDKLELLKDILNQTIVSKEKSLNTPVVAGITLAYRTPLMYYRQGGPFPFLKVEVLKGKLLPKVAKALEVLIEKHELNNYGLLWTETTCYEENIKSVMRFCCDTNIAGGAWVEIDEERHVELGTRCDEEIIASYRSLRGLTQDATMFMSDTPTRNEENCSVTPPLKILGLHVLYTWDETIPSLAKNSNLESVGICDIEGLSAVSHGKAAVSSKDPVVMISNMLQNNMKSIVFVYSKKPISVPGVDVRSYCTEREMLLAWQSFINCEIDPDIICLFQLKDSLRYLTGRFKSLKLGNLDISRFKGRQVQVKSVVTYGKHWVKQQSRMTATSNQEVFKASVEGRVVIDMLRVILVAYSLSTFTLGECSQVLLNKTKELLSLATVSRLWRGEDGGLSRLVYYTLQEAQVALELMEKLQTIPETTEMARVTGLTISDVLYKAQMIRVQSLLLRASSKEGWLLGGPTLGGQLSESPFLLHPREQNTAGFYENPVCILDFASLYPSVFMAYNLCYTTFVHPEDVHSLPTEQIFVSPSGAHFVKREVRHGILPRICGALIKARKVARDKMALRNTSAEEKAVLDGRQRALKLCSNALYGFTGAGASPQQALPLADSCLSLGAMSCKLALTLVESNFDIAKVVYAQTDSVFVELKGVTVDEALCIGKKMADTISESFTPPIYLKFERVLSPFLLLQVNRYAGKQYISDTQDDSNGTLFVRGLESDRRDVPYFVRRVCKSALNEVILNRDIGAAITECKKSIRELVSGKLSMFELLMTGGLWRVDDNDITRLAGTSKSPRKDRHGTADEGRGPHVALAVRLKRKNPDRQFHIGERIPYVLVESSSKLQDEMAEDPITALAQDMPINVHVYLENKLRKPLESILEYVVPASQLKDIFSGSHSVAATSSCKSRNSQSFVSNFFKKRASCLACRNVLDNERGVVCEDCVRNGAEQSISTVLISQRMEEEKKYASHTECLRCHSGGLTGCILCTNMDCPLFYLRYECCKRLEHINSSLLKLG